MTSVQQILHILLKDIRGHRWEIASLLLLNLVLIVINSESWPLAAERATAPQVFSAPRELGQVFSVLLIVTWCLAIARVVQAEAPASRKQFWLTRPYERRNLIMAKAAFIIVFVHLLTLVAQLITVAITGVPFSVPMLILNQFVLFVVVTLPAATLAALTRTVVPFIFAGLAIAALALTVMSSWSITNDGFWFSNGYFTENPNVGIDLLRGILGISFIALIACLAIAVQYRYRVTRRVAAWCAGGVAVVVLTLHTLPRPLVTWSQALLIGPSSEDIAFGLAADRTDTAVQRMSLRSLEDIAVPVEITGARLRSLALLYATVTLRPRAGSEVELPVEFLVDSNDELWIHFQTPPEFYAEHRNAEIDLAIDFDVKRYDETRLDTLTPGSALLIDGREQCGTGDRYRIFCRAVLRDPSRWNSFLSISDTATLTRQVAWIPIAIDPISKYEYLRYGAARRDVTPIEIVRRTPASYERVSFEFEGIRLADWSPESLTPLP